MWCNHGYLGLVCLLFLAALRSLAWVPSRVGFGRLSPPLRMSTGQAEEGKQQQQRMFIFGLGYVGSAFAKTLVDQGWHVSGTCTSVSKARDLRAKNINAFLFDAGIGCSNAAEVSEAIQSATHILSTVPPTPSAGTDAPDAILQTYGNDFLRSALSSSSPDNIGNKSLQWIGYLSSTGVYGDRGGGWVTELDEPDPDRPKTVARAEAERSWRRLHDRSGLPVHVFRLAGIYGPGRSAVDTILRAQGDFWSCSPDENTFISRIHVDDICTTLMASALMPRPGLIVNVADDLPATRFDVLAYACRLLEYPVIYNSGNQGNQGNQVLRETSRTGERAGVRGGSKRVDNSLLRRLLEASKTELKYPDYRSGLQALVDQMRPELVKGGGETGGDDMAATLASLEQRVAALAEEIKMLKLRMPQSSPSTSPSQSPSWRQEE